MLAFDLELQKNLCYTQIWLVLRLRSDWVLSRSGKSHKVRMSTEVWGENENENENKTLCPLCLRGKIKNTIRRMRTRMRMRTKPGVLCVSVVK